MSEQLSETQETNDDAEWAAVVAADEAGHTIEPEQEEVPAAQEAVASEPKAAVAQEEDELTRLRRERDEAVHKAKSEAGRQAALQRRLAEAEAKAREVSKAAAPAISEEEARALAKLKEDYPELSEVLDKRLGLVEKIVEQRVKETVEPLQNLYQEQSRVQQEAAIQQSLSVVTAKHPDWQQTVASPDFEVWLANQPPAFKSMVGSWDPSDINYVFDRFKESKQPQAAVAQAVASSRQNKLAAAAGIPSKPHKVEQQQGEDDDAIWQKLVEEERRQAASGALRSLKR